MLDDTVFNRDYKTQLRGRWATLQEQYSGWGRAESGRGSTLNAVLARKFDEGMFCVAASAHNAPAAPAAAATWAIISTYCARTMRIAAPLPGLMGREHSMRNECSAIVQ